MHLTWGTISSTVVPMHITIIYPNPKRNYFFSSIKVVSPCQNKMHCIICQIAEYDQCLLIMSAGFKVPGKKWNSMYFDAMASQTR